MQGTAPAPCWTPALQPSARVNTTPQNLTYPALPCRVVLTEVDPTGQVSVIISAEHCQHSSTLLPFTPYSSAGAAGGGGGGGFLDTHYVTSSRFMPRSCLALAGTCSHSHLCRRGVTGSVPTHPTKKKKKPFSLYIFCEIIQIWTGPGLVRS